MKRTLPFLVLCASVASLSDFLKNEQALEKARQHWALFRQVVTKPQQNMTSESRELPEVVKVLEPDHISELGEDTDGSRAIMSDGPETAEPCEDVERSTSYDDEEHVSDEDDDHIKDEVHDPEVRRENEPSLHKRKLKSLETSRSLRRSQKNGNKHQVKDKTHSVDKDEDESLTTHGSDSESDIEDFNEETNDDNNETNETNDEEDSNDKDSPRLGKYNKNHGFEHTGDECDYDCSDDEKEDDFEVAGQLAQRLKQLLAKKPADVKSIQVSKTSDKNLPNVAQEQAVVPELQIPTKQEHASSKFDRLLQTVNKKDTDRVLKTQKESLSEIRLYSDPTVAPKKLSFKALMDTSVPRIATSELKAETEPLDSPIREHTSNSEPQDVEAQEQASLAEVFTASTAVPETPQSGFSDTTPIEETPPAETIAQKNDISEIDNTSEIEDSSNSPPLIVVPKPEAPHDKITRVRNKSQNKRESFAVYLKGRLKGGHLWNPLLWHDSQTLTSDATTSSEVYPSILAIVIFAVYCVFM